ncbi:MAG: NUDIX hydrolase [Pseudomonadales bacterium]|nr:NUDIX hydrolase [Pseudomonadales bacterium]
MTSQTSQEYDPDSVEIRKAATVMMVDDRPDLQIFMMERNANILFGGGMWVFPGGRVDDADNLDEYNEVSFHLSDAEASNHMDLSAGGLTYYVAAVREVFEEAGILLAIDKDTHQPVDFSDPSEASRFSRLRDDINDSNKNFIDLLQEENLLLDTGAMHYIARWITPVGPPRRYDTRFFITRIPASQTPVHDDNELVHSEWMTPASILQQVEAGAMTMMTPTLRMIKNLAMFSSAQEAIRAAAQGLPTERARVNQAGVIIMPGEPDYDVADETIENGWVRFRPLPVS